MRVFVLALSAVFILACNSIGDKMPDFQERGLPKLVQSVGEFGFSLFPRLHAPDKNLFLSPLSIHQALVMALAGARGETLEAMERSLRLEGLTPEEVAIASRLYLDGVRAADGGVRFSLANSIWHRPEIKCLPDFLRLTRDYLRAGIKSLEFSDPSAPSKINGWISEKTEGMIDHVLDSIPADTVMYLINAIFFHGSWQRAFDEARTIDGEFDLANGAKAKVKLMTQAGKFRYYSDRQGAVVELPYGDGRFAMLAFLPNDRAGLHNYLLNLNWQEFNRIRAAMEEREGSVSIPRFKIEWGVRDLVRDLVALGMGPAFGAGADFSGINGTGNLAIDKVLHKAVIEVNEKGTKAAAVTVIGIRLTSVIVGEQGPFSFIANRPFAFVILDTETGLPVFAGALNSPD